MLKSVKMEIDFSKTQKALDKLAKLNKEETKIAVTQMVASISNQAIKNAPVGVSGGAGLKGSIDFKVQDSGKSIIGKVLVNSPYGVYVELGTGKAAQEYGGNPNRKMPPDEPIRLWVRRVLGINDEDELDNVTWLIRRKIKREGTKGKFFLTKAFLEKIPELNKIVTERIKIAIEKSRVQ